ncbi:Gfo/Idh/MocA family oxidoreductase [Aeoliella sp. ICT_H6.2]|uniref:Gfo/Idh/MocA family oxidoreductase n=1 Tax=Aeoliella straminimaris TaxID=2954799 RepID=A0A9X2F8T7_9BACT|nr:Gfo/Idh/MocA family oxidoreductase [Aeoliella straminimaris]MCO6043763.1 Gfo/Idh/MocA family oxidoreductase [Aeoliella straminimaris]
MSKPNNTQSNQGTDRRRFMATSSLAAAGIALGTSKIVGAAHPFGDDTIRIGLIGCGGRGSQAVGQALSTSDNVKLVAVADAFRDRIDGGESGCLNKRDVTRHGDKVDVPEERRFVGFDAYQKVLDLDDVDLVILATPPGFRPIHFEAAVNADKHVFMEKPVAVDAPGIRRVLAAAELSKAKGLGVGVGLQRRHDPLYIETIKRIQDGELGDIGLTRVYWNGGGVWVKGRESDETEMRYQMRNWYYFNWLCGDHIVEQHIHNLDVSNWLKDMLPTKAQGMGGREVRTGKDYGQIFDHHMVEFTYPDGSTMLSCCRHIPGCWSQVSEFADGTKGTSHVGSGKLVGRDGKPLNRYKGPRVNPYQQEHDDLFASIRSGSPLNEAEYGATSTMTAILGRLATYSGKVVSWDEATASKIDLSPDEYSWDATPPVVPDSNGNYPVPEPGKSVVV